MLKQSSLFKILSKKKLKIQHYYVLYMIHETKSLSDKQKSIILRKYSKELQNYLQSDCSLSDEGKKLIKRIDDLFKPIKKLSATETMGDNYKERIDEYLLLFPKGKLPNGKYARGNKKGIEENFKWFFQEYDFDWNTILSATSKYIQEYQKDNYKYMRTALYFIKKLREGIIESDLATYCQAYLDGDIEEKIVFKKKVV